MDSIDDHNSTGNESEITKRFVCRSVKIAFQIKGTGNKPMSK